MAISCCHLVFIIIVRFVSTSAFLFLIPGFPHPSIPLAAIWPMCSPIRHVWRILPTYHSTPTLNWKSIWFCHFKFYMTIWAEKRSENNNKGSDNQWIKRCYNGCNENQPYFFLHIYTLKLISFLELPSWKFGVFLFFSLWSLPDFSLGSLLFTWR